MSKKFNRVTFEELSNDFSHYEIAFISFCKASDIVLSGVSLLSNSRYKPKVAMVAFDKICSNLEETKVYKDELVQRFNCKYEEIVDDENYTVDDLI
ncbi:hypothetical protein [Alphaproteobacteria bacterium endosymbiont of Tiliacea citrago]|uniref:hypothetical protein n=1 Tax=Alphaproteobacteria bacterium endosymbiont of Tiliacea citrago TaxID=3077944 RepID=UPI00313EC6EB